MTRFALRSRLFLVPGFPSLTTNSTLSFYSTRFFPQHTCWPVQHFTVRILGLFATTGSQNLMDNFTWFTEDAN
jgi:hypothetical protein